MSLLIIQYYHNIIITIIIKQLNRMGKEQQRILQLNSLLSKLLDSLCSEVCVNRRDSNSLSMLEILVWKKKGQIDQLQFIQLYKSWLESKSIFDMFTCKQIETYPKNQFIMQQIVQQNFMNINQINKALQLINTAYNKLYIERKPNCANQLDQSQKIFSYLDTPGYIHLRMSSIFFFTGATIILQRYTVPLSYESFKIHMNDVRKQACEVDGIISLRSFKNYIFSLNSVKRTNYLQNLLNVFADIQTTIGGDKNCLPNIFDDVFYKWRSFPRFSSSQNRKNIQILRRIFQQNERIFYDQSSTIQYFIQKYGEQSLKCFQIDNTLLRQFNVLLKQSLHRYIQIFIKVSHKQNSKINQKSNSFMTHRKKQNSQLQQTKMSKMSSVRDKTPTKSQKNIQMKSMRTPTKIYNNDAKIRKQFESASKQKQRSYGMRTLTPTKSSYRQPTLHQSQAYTTSQKSAVKLGVDKDSFYNKMQFFRNKRVQSYQIVMKRLRGK